MLHQIKNENRSETETNRYTGHLKITTARSSGATYPNQNAVHYKYTNSRRSGLPESNQFIKKIFPDGHSNSSVGKSIKAV